MKIGILTFHRSYNYGAYMQCFSLVTRLKRDFPDVDFEIIDYTSRKVLDGYNSSVEAIKDEKLKKRVRLRNEAFRNCQEQLPLSSFQLTDDDYSSLVAYMNETYDAVIVGSDAVWNWTVRGFPNPYFLRDYHGIKLSYAASVHGMVFQDMTEDQKQYLQEAFSDFYYIGVRDTATEEMVHYVCPQLPVHHNCDPTVLLNLKDVPCDMAALKTKLEGHGVDFSKPLVGMMAGERVGREIKKYWADRIQLISVYEPNTYADVYLYDLTPYEWAHVFSLFKTTVTHFFHGTLLTLVNHKPVTAVEFESYYSSRNTTKINDVLSRLDLLSWRFTADYRDFSFVKKVLRRCKLWCDRALWTSVNQHIEKMITADCSEVIAKKLEAEANSYNSFKEAFAKIKKD